MEICYAFNLGEKQETITKITQVNRYNIIVYYINE